MKHLKSFNESDKPYTGIDGNKTISNLIEDINYALIDLKDEGWYTNVCYTPKRWENPGVKYYLKNDSIVITIKKVKNKSGSIYPSNGSLFNLQDIRQYTERIGEMFPDNIIVSRLCQPGSYRWNSYNTGIWGDMLSNYDKHILKDYKIIFGVEIRIYLKGENIDQNETFNKS
jgi:hypothetical protein